MISLATTLVSANQVQFAVSGASGSGNVRGAKLTGSCRVGAWSDLWAFSDNGTSSSITLAAGAWVFLAQSGSEISTLSHVLATTTDGLAVRCRSVVASFLRTMALPRIGDRIYEKRSPIDITASYPCVFVHLWDFAERDTGGGTNERTEWEYPVKILIGSRASQLDEAASNEILAWRQTILEAFDWWNPPTFDVQYTRSSPGAALQQYVYPMNNGEDFELTGSEITARCILRRPRGLP